MAKAKTKRRNQQDATLRNVRAANKRIDKLAADLDQLREQVAALQHAKDEAATKRAEYEVLKQAGLTPPFE